MARKIFKCALVTGSSAGIGRVYAMEIARRYHCSIVLTARREDRLESLKAEIEALYKEDGCTAQVVCAPCDLSSTEEIQRLISLTEKLPEPVDLLVNNAGFGSVKRFTSTQSAEQLSMVDVNCKAPLQLMHHFFPEMCERSGGSIINVCSTCSFQPMPIMATYGGTKAFLYSLSTALAEEGRRSGVQVMAHCPGPTESEFHLVSGLPEKLDHIPGMKTLPVVLQALDALDRGRTVIINGSLNYFLSYLSKYLPASASTRIVSWILRHSA